jgi:hypothetical protein
MGISANEKPLESSHGLGNELLDKLHEIQRRAMETDREPAEAAMIRIHGTATEYRGVQSKRFFRGRCLQAKADAGSIGRKEFRGKESPVER